MALFKYEEVYLTPMNQCALPSKVSVNGLSYTIVAVVIRF